LDANVSTARWSRIADAYAVSFESLCAGAQPFVLDRLGDVAGRTVLDVGTGTGTLATSAAAKRAAVAAVDPDADMLRLARSRTPVPLVAAALPQLPFAAGVFDVVVANFVVNHLADPRAGVRELARVSRERVAATIWPAEPSPRVRLLADVVALADASTPPDQRLAPELDFPRTTDGLAALFGGAGLADVEAVEVRWTWATPAEALWHGVAAGIGVVGRTYQGAPGRVRSRMRAAFDDLFRPLTGPDGLLHLPETAVLATGHSS
jgi:SAM-dependent methyltransferase